MQLILGDCLDVLPTIPDKSVDMVLCDLPYGTTKCKWDAVIPLHIMWQEYRRVIRGGGAIVLTCSQPFTSKLISSNYDDFRYCWVWNKAKAANFPLAKKQPLKVHEDIAVFGGRYTPLMTSGIMRKKGGYSVAREAAVSAGTPAKHNDQYYPKSILDFSVAGNGDSGLHPTQKPVALMEYLIRTYTNPGDVVLDNCMGSGTTGVACRNTGRAFIGIERDDGYFELARRRVCGVTDDCQRGLAGEVKQNAG